MMDIYGKQRRPKLETLTSLPASPYFQVDVVILCFVTCIAGMTLARKCSVFLCKNYSCHIVSFLRESNFITIFMGSLESDMKHYYLLVLGDMLNTN